MDGVQTKLGRLPLLEGLEHQGHRAQVGHVELLERGHGLGVVLAGGPPDEREAGEVDARIDHGLAV